MPYKDKNKRPDKGLCTDCPNPNRPYYRKCEKCLERDRVNARERMAKLRPERIAKGLCYKCGRPLHEDADEGRISCIKCREAGKWSYYKKR